MPPVCRSESLLVSSFDADHVLTGALLVKAHNQVRKYSYTRYKLLIMQHHTYRSKELETVLSLINPKSRGLMQKEYNGHE